MTWTLFTLTRPQIRDQGWKVHIASSVDESPRLFDSAIPFLISNRHPFKLPSTLEDVRTINSGRAGTELIGKIVTVYPRDDNQLLDLITKLDLLWRSDRAPQVLTDLRIPGHVSISFRFGSFRSGVVVRDAAGRLHPAVRRPDGALVQDERRLDGRQPRWTIPPVFGAIRFARQQRDEMTIRGQRLFLVATMQSMPKGDTFLAADESLQPFVIKTARRGVAEDRHGRDSCDRLQREAGMLGYLSKKGYRSPRVHAGTPDKLVLQDIDGVPLNKLPRVKIGDAVRKFAGTVADLHDLGVVHRDLKLSNAILSKSNIYLIDFELAGFVGDKDVPGGGTKGFIPPEGTGARASPAYDIYALGACIAHAALGVWPGELVPGVGRLKALLISCGEGRIAEIVATAMAARPSVRPSARELERKLSQLPGTWPMPSRHLKATTRVDADVRTRRRRRVVEAAAHSYATAIGLRDRKDSSRHPGSRFDDAIALGTAGLAIGLSLIDFATEQNGFDRKIVRAAEQLVESDRSGPAFGLFTGQAGVAFTLALVGRKYERSDFLDEAVERFTFAADHVTEPDLFSGSAGIVWGACLLASVLEADWPLKAAERAARRLKRNVRADKHLLIWRSPGRPADEAYFGAAHGSAGIAMALAAWAHANGGGDFRELARATFARLYRHGRTSERRHLRDQANSMEGVDNAMWCHGATGYLWCMLQAFGDHKSLRKPIDWAFRAFSDVPLVANPSYCHGMAGQLDLWRLLGRYPRFAKVAKERAPLAATLLEHLGYRSKGSWTWPGDQLDETDPTLWSGSLGPACALALFEKGISDPLFSPDLLRQVFQPKEKSQHAKGTRVAHRRSRGSP